MKHLLVGLVNVIPGVLGTGPKVTILSCHGDYGDGFMQTGGDGGAGSRSIRGLVFRMITDADSIARDSSDLRTLVGV